MQFVFSCAAIVCEKKGSGGHGNSIVRLIELNDELCKRDYSQKEGERERERERERDPDLFDDNLFPKMSTRM